MRPPEDQRSASLEALLDRFAQLVRGVGRRHGLSEADLDEVLQDVRIRLWRARQGSEQIAALRSSYVYRTASTAALDLIRRRRRKREAGLEELDMTPMPVPTVRPDEALDAAEFAEQVSNAVDGIVETRRPVVRMYLAGYAREEIAELLGWTEAKTRNLLYRGLAELRERLAERGIGPEVVR